MRSLQSSKASGTPGARMDLSHIFWDTISWMHLILLVNPLVRVFCIDLSSWNHIRNEGRLYQLLHSLSSPEEEVFVASHWADVFYSAWYYRGISRGELEKGRGISVFWPHERCQNNLQDKVQDLSEAKVRHWEREGKHWTVRGKVRETKCVTDREKNSIWQWEGKSDK